MAQDKGKDDDAERSRRADALIARMKAAHARLPCPEAAGRAIAMPAKG